MKKFLWIVSGVLFGQSLGWVYDHLGSNWYNLYMNLIILILSIGCFWEKTVWMFAAGSITIVFLYLLDHQFPAYDNIFINYIKTMYVFLMAFIYYWFFKRNNRRKNHPFNDKSESSVHSCVNVLLKRDHWLKYMMKKNFRVISALLFIFSLGWVNAYLGPNWYNLYLNLVILILSIVLFWKKTVWMVAVSSITIVFLYLLDHQFSVYDNGYIKTTCLLLLVVVYCLFNDSNGENHQESAS